MTEETTRAGLAGLASGGIASPEDDARARRCLIVALGHSSGQVHALADRLADLQAAEGDFKPIVVVRSSATRRLRHHGFLYERVMPPSQWRRTASRTPYAEHVSRRVDRIADMYEAHVRVELPAGAELTGDALRLALGKGSPGQQASAGAAR